MDSPAATIKRKKAKDATAQIEFDAAKPSLPTLPTFDAEYAKLNPSQKEAVNTVEGPLMVIAGPGTGKTQVVALRVANILRTTQMRPSNILCLTFSNSGATAMRERLRSLIGPDAYGVTVSTIHGFCNDVIGANPSIFEAWASLEQISDVERYRSLNKIIDQLMPQLELINQKYPYQRTRDILARISQVKREGKTIADLQVVADAYDREMASLSKPGTKAHEKNLTTARKFRDFIKLFEGYESMLRSTQRYDYDDMILHVIRALSEDESLLEKLQVRYQYVLVDEFQDTNGSQARLIELLTTYPTVDHEPNLCVVGDDDQAIYRFQGANLQNILSFRARFPHCPIVVLSTSYRCSQPILNAAMQLIGYNSERLVGTIDGVTKDLTAGATKSDAKPELLLADTELIEPWVIADLVAEEMANGTTPQEIAILTQTNAELPPLCEVLQARGIPVHVEGDMSLLDQPRVRQILSILRAIHQPEDDALLASAFACECFECHPADLGRLFGLARRKRTSLYELLLTIDAPKNPAHKLPWIRPDAMMHARDTLLSLHQQLGNRTVVDTLEHVLKDCGILPPIELATKTLDPVSFAAVQALFERVKYRCYEQTHFTFQTFLNDLELYASPDYPELRLTFHLPHLAERGVSLMTAHRSKGLEFDVVILPQFREGHWDGRRNPSSLAFPEDLLYGWSKEQKAVERNQDERRVAYVAMTRARRRLVFTCPKELIAGEKARQVAPSGFFVQAGTLPQRECAVKDPSSASLLLHSSVRQIDAEFQAFLRERLKDFHLSVTSLNHFLEDPQMFLEVDLLQFPQAKNQSLAYGSAVHAALRTWGLSIKEGHPLKLEQLIAEFTNYLVDREILTDESRRSLIQLGNTNLPRYFQERMARTLPIIHRVEWPLSAHLGDIPLKGLIDRIDLDHPDSARATIIDYKTGRPKSESEIRNGDYFRQLTFYALLLEKADSLLDPHTFILDFVGEGTDGPTERRFTITETEKKGLSEVIHAVWEKIQSLDFTPL